jgi:hypothetical protein
LTFHTSLIFKRINLLRVFYKSTASALESKGNRAFASITLRIHTGCSVVEYGFEKFADYFVAIHEILLEEATGPSESQFREAILTGLTGLLYRCDSRQEKIRSSCFPRVVRPISKTLLARLWSRFYSKRAYMINRSILGEE